VVEYYRYNPYGTPAIYGPSTSTDQVKTIPVLDRLFQGYRFDSALQLYFSAARVYDPHTARFLTPDREDLGAGNRYGFGDLDPIDNRDPTGGQVVYSDTGFWGAPGSLGFGYLEGGFGGGGGTSFAVPEAVTLGYSQGSEGSVVNVGVTVQHPEFFRSDPNAPWWRRRSFDPSEAGPGALVFEEFEVSKEAAGLIARYGLRAAKSVYYGIYGRAFEDRVFRVLEKYGATRIGKMFGETVSGVGRSVIPDLRGLGLFEVKSGARVKWDDQMQAMVDAAREAGEPLSLIVSERTKSISLRLQLEIRRLGGKIVKFNPVTETFAEWLPK
jgi:RHS repeat-associated protein